MRAGGAQVPAPGWSSGDIKNYEQRFESTKQNYFDTLASGVKTFVLLPVGHPGRGLIVVYLIADNHPFASDVMPISQQHGESQHHSSSVVSPGAVRSTGLLCTSDMWGADSVTKTPIYPCDNGDCTEVRQASKTTTGHILTSRYPYSTVDSSTESSPTSRTTTC